MCNRRQLPTRFDSIDEHLVPTAVVTINVYIVVLKG